MKTHYALASSATACRMHPEQGETVATSYASFLASSEPCELCILGARPDTLAVRAEMLARDLRVALARVGASTDAADRVEAASFQAASDYRRHRAFLAHKTEPMPHP